MEKYKSNDEVITPNGPAVVIGEMAAEMAGCVLVRHRRGIEFDPKRAVKLYGLGRQGQAAAYKLADVHHAQGLGI